MASNPEPLALPPAADRACAQSLAGPVVPAGEVRLQPASLAADTELPAPDDSEFAAAPPLARPLPVYASAADAMAAIAAGARELPAVLATAPPQLIAPQILPTMTPVENLHSISLSPAPGTVPVPTPAAGRVDAPVVTVHLLPFEIAPSSEIAETMPMFRERWMAAPPPEAVERELIPVSVRELPLALALALPGLGSLSAAEPWMPGSDRLRPPLSAEPVSMHVGARSTVVTMPSKRLGVPAIPEWCASAALPATVLAGLVAGPAAEPVECLPFSPALQPGLILCPHQMRQPVLPAIASIDAGITELDAVTLDGATPAVPGAATGALEPVSTLFAVPPEAGETARPLAAIPLRAFIPLDFFCQRTAGAPKCKLAWHPPTQPPILPGLGLRPILERLEDALPQKKNRKGPEIAEVFDLPGAPTELARRAALRHVLQAAAACVLLGAILWFGAGTVRIGNQTPAVNRDASSSALADDAAGTAVAPAPNAPATAPGKPVEKPNGPMVRLKAAIADRAAATETDSFRNGMEAWGTMAKQWAPGWSRHSDGYVETGQLALFHPKEHYQDYHLAFFGQIESKSIGWVVRAHDQKNYYAMKFTVVEPGLRPIIAIVHYPVVDGKKGRPVSVPLNVMVHNNTPMQVDVEVRGDKLLTSIDGQLVDTWIDDTLVAGGAGFFSEAGEHARLYWMKISKNEDFLGRICAYVSRRMGDGSAATAELRPARAPRQPEPRPQPAPERIEEAALASAAAGLENRTFNLRRRTSWNS